jgi:predicted HTH transcriptional regulator
MKFLKSIFLLAGLTFVIVKIFEDSSYESRKEVEKITIDFDPKSHKVTSTSIESDEDPDEEDSADLLLNELQDAPKAERKEIIENLAEKLHAGEDMLSPRQKKIIDVLNEHGKIDTTLLQNEIPKITIRTLRRDLDALGKMGIIKKMGTTKGSYYVRV